MFRPALPMLLLIAALPASAQTPLSAAAFEALSTGRTLTYAVDGTVYGTEHYLPGRRVVWAFTADECRFGTWYEAGGEICFVYDHDPAPQCWTFFDAPGGLTARFAGDPPGTELTVVGDADGPLPCPGPDLGV